MPLPDQELIEKSKLASEYAYAPYSNFRVGSVLEAEDGQVFTGCNVENAAYPASLCAERTAVVKAVSTGCRKFSRVTVYA